MSPDLATTTPTVTPATDNKPYQARRLNSGQFAPGSTGNPHGRPRTAYFRRRALQTLRQEIAAGIERGHVMMDAIVSKAETGDLNAAEFLRDTVDGPIEAGNNTTVGVAVTVEHVGAVKD